MEIAFIIYNGMTALNFIGIYDPVTRLKTMGFVQDREWEICAHSEEVSDNARLRFTPTRVRESLENYDLVIVPGGFILTIRKLIDNAQFIEWLGTAEPCKLEASVCTGALLLGAAGFLRGKIATTHPNHFDDLKKFCSSVVNQRIVDEGNVITARGVTSSIDLGLYLCEKLAGHEIKEKIRRQMDYGHII
jgi:cyclohexyl-isocyanide hydratase